MHLIAEQVQEMYFLHFMHQALGAALVKLMHSLRCLHRPCISKMHIVVYILCTGPA